MTNPLNKKPFIIADVGSNWARGTDSFELALRHIDDAALCGASAVKFQCFTTKELYGFDGLDTFSLPSVWLPMLAARCSDRGVEFMCTAFSPEGVKTVDPFVNIHKIASCEMLHLGILDAVLDTGKCFLISTGAAHESEIHTLKTYIARRNPEAHYQFLECVAAYPARAQDYLLSPDRGISDHTHGNVTALCALGKGARVFEKHFDALKDFGDRVAATPDTEVSSGPRAFRHYCEHLAEGIAALEEKPKHFRQSEQDIVSRHRRRLKIIKDMKKGDPFEYERNYGIYRSLTQDSRAASPLDFGHFMNRTAKRDMKIGEGLWLDDAE